MAEPRDVRARALVDQQRTADQPPRLPSRKALVGILDGLSAVLFPNRLDRRRSRPTKASII